MSVKISELPSASSVTSSDVVPIVQGGTTKKADVTTLIGATSFVPSYMGIKSTSNIATTTTGNWTKYRLVLPTIERSNGNKFTFDSTNGAIVVGADVTKVKATLTATWQSSSANETSFGVYFYNHSTDTWSTLQPSFAENQSAWCTGSASLIIDVTEGDKIGVSFNTWVNGTITTNAQTTGLLVEEYIGTTREYEGTSTIATSITSSSTNDEVAGAKAVFDLNSYSTTEHVVGTWIDGKPLYKITYPLTCPTTSAGEVTQDISSLNYESIINMTGISKLKITNASTYYRLVNNTYAYNSSSVSEFSDCWIKDNTLYFRYSGYNSINSFTVTISIYYTKSTDSAS